MKKSLDAALEYLERGWSVIPIKPDGKRPAIKWREFQTRLPTEEEVTAWWTKWPNHSIALVTGSISGVVVVDCDNQDASHAAFDSGMRSPIKAKTKRGEHLYFTHPRDGKRRGPKAGVTAKDDWPHIDGLDFRGDGSYALVPPSKNYEWDYAQHVFDWDEMPVWKDWSPKIKDEPEPEFSFEALDLSSVKAVGDFVSEWDRTAQFVRDNFPSSHKIPSGLGNGRNERVMRYVSECVLEGVFGAELRVRGHAFMREFFEDVLCPEEFEATVKSMEDAEKRNHPERFNDGGDYVYGESAPETDKHRTRKLIQMKDADALLAEADAETYLIEPWLPTSTIVQVYGYAGHGKSMFVQHAVAALASGKKYFGCFEIGKAARVLYLDFEMGMATVARRLIDMKQIHGDTGDRLNIWTPFIDDKDMDLHKREGLIELEGWIEFARPDVVVIDTVRSAYPALQENSAEEWAKVNKLAVKLRNAGLAVILIHHSNKPSDTGSGREAGSTNQLTVLETQIRVAQVFKEKETARQNAALYDGDYDNPVWPLLEAKLPPHHTIYMVTEIRYGKVREWTDLHDRVQWIGYAINTHTDEKMIVSSRSTKQRAKDLALDGEEASVIADRLGRPESMIRDWLELPKR